MATKAEDLLNGTAATSDYPAGRITDETTKGAGDGTPLNLAMFTDFFEFFGKLMNDASIAFNSDPDNVTNGYQYVEALIEKIKKYTSLEVNISAKDVTDSGANQYYFMDSEFDRNKVLIGSEFVGNGVIEYSGDGGYSFSTKTLPASGGWRYVKTDGFLTICLKTGTDSDKIARTTNIDSVAFGEITLPETGIWKCAMVESSLTLISGIPDVDKDLMRSTNNGASFTAISTGYNGFDVIAYTNNNNIIAIERGSSNHEVIYSTDQGLTWNTSNSVGFAPDHIEAADGDFYAFKSSGERAISTDGGVNWTALSNAADGNGKWKYSPETGLWMDADLSSTGKIYISDDAGETVRVKVLPIGFQNRGIIDFAPFENGFFAAIYIDGGGVAMITP